MVSTLKAGGAITATRAGQILTGAAEVQAQLTQLSTATTDSGGTTSVATTTTVAHPGDHGSGKGPGRDHSKGGGGD